MSTDRVPDTLLGGRYRLDDVIGRGGMGQVYRAWDLCLGRRVAIKVIAPDLAGDPEIAARLRAEARHLAATEHPNLVTLFDVSDEADAAYLVMELVEGESLAARLRRDGPLGTREIAAIVTGVAAGLSALHGAGIVHRDISPANILLGLDGRARLADFGLARDVAHGRRHARPGRHDGDDEPIQGTLRYLAPELLDGAAATMASDVYALAAVTYVALLGRPPALSTNMVALRAAYREPPIRPSLLRPGLDPAVDEVLLGALRSAVGRPSAYQFAVTLAAALRLSGDAASPLVETVVVPSWADQATPRRGAGPVRRTMLAMAGAALLLGLGAASLTVMDGALASPRGMARVTDAVTIVAEPTAEPVSVPVTTPAPAEIPAPVSTPMPEPHATPQQDVRLAIADRRTATTAVAAKATAPKTADTSRVSRSTPDGADDAARDDGSRARRSTRKAASDDRSGSRRSADDGRDERGDDVAGRDDERDHRRSGRRTVRGTDD